MLGWDILVNRQIGGGASPATWQSQPGNLVATWREGLGGMEWLDELVKSGNALNLGGDGYPDRASAAAGALIRVITQDLPRLRGWTVVDKHGEKVEPGRRQIVINGDVIAACDDQEWLLIEAWDLS
jgi:hypothetical protein